MNNNKNTFSGSFIEFFSMLVFFSLLVFSMIGCGGEGMRLPPPGNPDSDMMVFNPDAGTDMGNTEDLGTEDAGMMDVDAGTEDMGMVEADADVMADAGNTDSDVEADAGTEEDAAVLPDSDVPPVDGGVDAGPVEDLYVVWVPEKIAFNNSNHEASLVAATAVCESVDGVVYSGPWSEWFLGIVENSPVVEGLRPEELEPANCPLLTDSITTCSHYLNLAEATCTNTANTFCNNLFNCPNGIGGAQWIGRYNSCLVSNTNMSNYTTCSNDTACENEEEIRNNGFVGRAYRSAPGSNHLVPWEGTAPSVVNVICVLPESAVTAEFGANYEYAVPYTGAAQ